LPRAPTLRSHASRSCRTQIPDHRHQHQRARTCPHRSGLRHRAECTNQTTRRSEVLAPRPTTCSGRQKRSKTQSARASDPVKLIGDLFKLTASPTPLSTAWEVVRWSLADSPASCFKGASCSVLLVSYSFPPCASMIDRVATTGSGLLADCVLPAREHSVVGIRISFSYW